MLLFMIYERSIFLFAWTISGFLASSETCFAKGSNHTSNSISLVRTADIKQLNRAVPQNYGNRNLIVQQPKLRDANEPEEMLSKRWTGIGIGVTSIFFCFLLWILFQPNSQIKTISTLTNKNDDEQDNDINLSKEHQLEFKDEVSLPPLFTLKEDDLSQKSSDQSTVIQQAHLIREKQHNSNLTISEDIQDLTTKHEPVEIDADNQGLIRITTANTTDIDVVFELIQDLKNSDRQLRRKAIWELAKTGDSRSIEPLINTISGVNSLDKSLILSAISQIAHRSFEPIYDVLFATLKDVNSEVRKDAIRDITALHESTAKISRHLTVMLQDSDEEVRQTAQWALKRINTGSLPKSEKYTVNKAISSNNKSKQN